MSIKKMKIAFLGASHWHVPLYLPAIKADNLQVVGISDPKKDFAEKFANQLGCKAYTQGDSLLENEKPDFVFAFDIHSEMPKTAKKLIDLGIPFSIEKPLGVCAQDVADVKRAAEEKGVYCSIPFVWRYSDIMKELKNRISSKDISNFSFMFIAGPPSRYEIPSPWMLKKATAGTGCMTNLGVHFIDLALWLSESESAECLSSSFHYMNGYDVEDYACALLRLSSKASMMLQTGYAYPMDDGIKRDSYWNITTNKGYYSIRDDYLEIREYGTPAYKSNYSTDSDIYYSIYTTETLRDYDSGKIPQAGLDDMLRTRLVLDDIIVKATTGIK